MLLIYICILTPSSSPIIAIMLGPFTYRFSAEVSLFLVLFSVDLNFYSFISAIQTKTTKSWTEESSETTRADCNASNFLLSWSLNVCALSLPLHHRINLLFHLPVPPPSRCLIHLISASWLVQSPPPFSTDSSSVRPALLAAPYSGAVVSPVESDCAGGREVNWKKLRCSHRGAEARGNKLDISPIHVGWRVYTIYTPHPLPHCRHPQHSHAHSHIPPLWSEDDWRNRTRLGNSTTLHYHRFMQVKIYNARCDKTQIFILSGISALSALWLFSTSLQPC